jgi:putative phosphoribosyl transferase
MNAEISGHERFANRQEAGEALADALAARFAGDGAVLVLALPRGGVPVARVVAERLGAPLDVFLVRRLTVPDHPELAIGAVASGGMRVFNQGVLDQLNLPPMELARQIGRAEEAIHWQELGLRGHRPFPAVQGKTVILVDDGLATGATMLAAVRTLRLQHPVHVVVAVPVSPQATCHAIEREADELVCLQRPQRLVGVGAWYDDYVAPSDEELRRLVDAPGFAGRAAFDGEEKRAGRSGS